jgi:hypothetical protein
MTDRRGNNEGLRLLEEFVCQAIPNPSLQGSGVEPSIIRRGTNQGIQSLQEVVLEAGSPQALDAAQRNLS